MFFTPTVMTLQSVFSFNTGLAAPQQLRVNAEEKQAQIVTQQVTGDSACV